MRHYHLSFHHLLANWTFQCIFINVSRCANGRARRTFGSEEEDKDEESRYDCADKDASCELTIRHAKNENVYTEYVRELSVGMVVV